MTGQAVCSAGPRRDFGLAAVAASQAQQDTPEHSKQGADGKDADGPESDDPHATPGGTKRILVAQLGKNSVVQTVSAEGLAGLVEPFDLDHNKHPDHGDHGLDTIELADGDQDDLNDQDDQGGQHDHTERDNHDGHGDLNGHGDHVEHVVIHVNERGNHGDNDSQDIHDDDDGDGDDDDDGDDDGDGDDDDDDDGDDDGDDEDLWKLYNLLGRDDHDHDSYRSGDSGKVVVGIEMVELGRGQGDCGERRGEEPLDEASQNPSNEPH